MKPDDTLTIPELSARLRISRRSIERAVTRGEIRVVRVGRRVLVTCAELARVLGCDVADLEGRE
jgi:excisionase family DNA binding protein